MERTSETVADRLQARFDSLTRAERQLAATLLENYPVSGLGTSVTIGANAGVSTPTVARLVQKLGFAGFAEFQARLRAELEAKISSPIAKHESWTEGAPDTHILNRFTDAVTRNIRMTLSQIDPAAFDAACDLLAQGERTLFMVGGRITRTLADYFFLHMQVIRENVTHVPSNSNAWPHFVLDMRAGDCLVIFDIRRYEQDTLKLAEMARTRGVSIILLTDQWRSPIARLATHTFSCRIEVPSAWDSSIAMTLLVEAMIASVQSRTWPATKARMETLEDLFDQTLLFRRTP